MGGRWNLYGFQSHKVLCAILMLHLLVDECLSLNLEGLALLGFRSKVEVDPYGVFVNWDPGDRDPCNWLGVHCVDGKVDTLNLKGLSLGGILSPELGKLSHLRALVLYKNKFSGIIPKEIGGLTMLELLDLRGNNLSGIIPTEIGQISSLKHLLLCDNKFQDATFSWAEKSNTPSVSRHEWSLPCDATTNEVNCLNRKVGDCFWQSGVNSARRKLFEANSNLQADPLSSVLPREAIPVPSTGSGSFPAVPEKQSPKGPTQSSEPPNQPSLQPTNSSDKESSKSVQKWIYILVLSGVALLVILGIMIWMCRSRGVATIRPRMGGLSGQLQKAFITGVPKLNREELEAACEGFSNILSTTPNYTVFKGILSSGVEIAVVTSAVASTKDWSKRSEICFRKKIDSISRVKHKNFINLLGYCQEDEPFMRMMVFEYAPNGTLFEHLHVKEFEHLDWSYRMRIIMGIAYCLQHMHHELTPPLALPDLQSSAIFITDDYAGKVADMSIWKEFIDKGKISGDGDMDPSQSHRPGPESNVYKFGILLLEIISGKVPYVEEQGSIPSWAAEYLNDKGSIRSLTDPTLKSVKDEELEVVCDVIQECMHQDPKKRPAMKEVTAKLREVIAISPEAATPRLSPLWWAELEILSVEAS